MCNKIVEIMINDMSIENELLKYINKIIRDKTGIHMPEGKKYLLIHKLEKLLRNNNYGNLEAFCNLIKSGNADGIENLINNFTTNHTFFFREKSHLKLLAEDIKIKKNDNPVIWCAACSTGEEVYSMIIYLLENNINDFVIIASDINKEVLIHMKKGFYNESRLNELTSKIINKYFMKEGSYYKVKDCLKKYYVVKRINLIDNIRFEKKVDYIFCRNVLMYFKKSTQKNVIDMLLRNLNDNGYIFVGHSESLLHLNDRLESVFNSVYRKKL